MTGMLSNTLINLKSDSSDSSDSSFDQVLDDIKPLVVGQPLNPMELTDDHLNYIGCITKKMAEQNAAMVISEGMFDNKTHHRNLVCATKGLTKSVNDDLYTDDTYTGDLGLHQRCELLKRFNDTAATLVHSFIPDPTLKSLKFEKVINSKTETCKIYRVADYNK